jgi:hypothetical protein
MNTTLPFNMLLAKNVLTNLWYIARYIELTIKKAQFMYAMLLMFLLT